MDNPTTIQRYQHQVAEISRRLDRSYNEAWDVALVISEQAGDVARRMLHRDSYPVWQEWEEEVAKTVADLIVCALAMYNYLGRDAERYMNGAIQKHQRRMENKVKMDYDKVVLDRLAYAHSKGFLLPHGINEEIAKVLSEHASELSPSIRAMLSLDR